jgi:hypothetical protein
VFHHIIHIPLTMWRAYMRRVRAAEGRRKLAWIVVPIVGVLLLIGMLAPTPPAASSSVAAPVAMLETVDEVAPEATALPIVDVAPTEAPAVDEPAPAETSVPDAETSAPAAARGAVAPVGDDCPPEAMIKGNQGKSDWIYHRPGSSSYSRTDPEQCFATSADAEAAGYRAANR